MNQSSASNHPLSELELSARRFHWLFHSSPNLLAVIASDDTISIVSNSARKILGCEPAEIIGKSFYNIICRDDREEVRAFLNRKDNDHPDLLECRALQKDGSLRFLEVAASDPFAERDLSGILITARDITRRKELEQQFLRAQRLETIGTLAGGVAHDLNNILAPVLLSIEMLKRGVTDKQKLKMFEVMESSVNKGRNIVRQVLTYARGIEGEQTLIQLRHLTKDVLEIVTQTFPANIRVEQDVPKDTWIVQADVTQLHQVFMNLLVNSRDAMPNGGVITVSAENLTVDEPYTRMVPHTHPGAYVVITISDTGTGIPHELMESIFDPFFTTKELGKGTGLGLSTVKQIIESHDGTVAVESKVGSGTKFRIYLPATPGVEAESEKKQFVAPPSGHGEFVIVADDDESVRDITRQTLEAFGYAVRTAADGAEALALMVEEKARTRVLLTDFTMPVMDGRQLIKAVQKMGFNIKIIVASGTSMTEEAKKDISADVDAILSKPFTARKLLTTIHDLLPTGSAGENHSQAA